MKSYSLRKSKKILFHVYHLLRRKKKRLLPAQVQEVQQDLRSLQEEILKKNREGANFQARKCGDYASGILKKSLFEQIRDFVFSLVFALAVALLIRQVWFELYEIPTGSMRPTFREKDRLIVSKTTFGINIPFTTDHLYFDPDLVQRSSAFVFSAENMDVHDPDTMYFYIFPGKKQLVKRLMGKPGDTLYFYGGQMYGIDEQGNDITDKLQPKRLSHINHVPYYFIGGKNVVSEPFQSSMGPAYRMSIIYQMHEPLARLTALSDNRFEGEVLSLGSIHNKFAPPVKNYYQLWGIGNYALARIVERDEVRSQMARNGLSDSEAKYFLELKHTPNIDHLELKRDQWNRLCPQFILSSSLLPLDEAHLHKIFAHLYTARFTIKNGFAMRYSDGKKYLNYGHVLPRFDGVPDGTYEFCDGVAYRVFSPPFPIWGGLLKKLRPDHPLQKFSAERVKALYNLGVWFDKRAASGPDFNTERFGYFKYGDFITMGAPLFTKGEPELQKFIDNELQRKEQAHPQSPYIPFIDQGPPLTADGKIDVAFLKQYGLLIPPNSYLALGDNFAGSADSRDFGFVPQGNIKGAPSFIFWPFGSRFGPPNQPPYPWFTLSNLLIWGLVLLCLGWWYYHHRKYRHLPLTFENIRDERR